MLKYALENASFKIRNGKIVTSIPCSTEFLYEKSPPPMSAESSKRPRGILALALFVLFAARKTCQYFLSKWIIIKFGHHVIGVFVYTTSILQIYTLIVWYSLEFQVDTRIYSNLIVSLMKSCLNQVFRSKSEKNYQPVS